MRAPEVTVVDYGIGNLLSVCRALAHCGASVKIGERPNDIFAAQRVILPGVGAFADGMAEMQLRGIDVAVREVSGRGVPLLGICLGMQMLLDESEEFGLTPGLGLIAGRVIPVPRNDAQGKPHKIPHIGWSSLVVPSGREDWRGTLLNDLQQGVAVYFVHSFMADPAEPKSRVANCMYGGLPVTATVHHDNVFGCQFHPEKSGEVGLHILKNFLAQ
jgi:glutamine amidotransferase